MTAFTAKLCVFAAYGTLFDLGTVIAGFHAKLGEAAPGVLEEWRRKQLEYTWLRSLMERYAPFDQVTADALRHALGRAGMQDAELEAGLLDGYERVRPYPDVEPALDALRAAGVRCAILSNGTPAMLSSALASSGLAGCFEAVLSVVAVRRYKPDPAVYAMVEKRLRVAPGETVFVSSNPWDVDGAATFGLRTVWLNRAGGPAEPLPGTPALVLASMTGLPSSLGKI
jgi:2-haloacid dehalogenase